ncbi:hypothetical protein J2749_001703 [Methanobacterium oryzae]
MCIFLLKYFQYPINSDGISYISIAQIYAHGSLIEAINGYWGPLISWIMFPFLFLDLSPLNTLFIGEIISLIIGFFTLIGIRQLSYKFEMKEEIRTIILFSMVPIILYFWLRAISPDLLIICFLIFYLNIIFSSNYYSNIYNGLFCGILGSLAYLSKSYAFPFFLVHFILFNLLHYWRFISKKEKRKVLKNLLLGLTIFFIISGLWIGIISNKYSEITIGTSGEYNQDLVGPGSKGHPVFFQGLIKPSSNSAISAWEDPSYIKTNSWSPLNSWNNFNYQIDLIRKNIQDTLDIFVSFSYLSLIIILTYFLLFIRSSKNKILKGHILYPLLTIGLYSAGYFLIWVEDRYLWIIYILLFLMGGVLLSKLFEYDFFNKEVRYTVIVFFVWSFLVTPAFSLTHTVENDIDTEGVYDLSQTLKMQYGIQGNIASNDEWQKSLYISFYLNSKYYGQVKSNITNSELKSELESNNIDYYFVWGDDNSNLDLLSNYKEITKGNIKGLTVYSLKKNKNL